MHGRQIEFENIVTIKVAMIAIMVVSIVRLLVIFFGSSFTARRNFISVVHLQDNVLTDCTGDSSDSNEVNNN